MERIECDIAVIGAGVAGLAATSRLRAAGKHVVCLEATNRIGGRILTVHDPLVPSPIELGAEFVHGLPRETWELIRQAGLTAYEHTPEAVYIDQGQGLADGEGEAVDSVFSQVARSGANTDESFEAYLQRSGHSPEAKQRARMQIEGFNAARSELISTASLAQDARAADQIDGDRGFRIVEGYEAIPFFLLRSIGQPESSVRLNCVVSGVDWRQGSVHVQCRSAIDGSELKVHCRQLIVTVPLGVLQATDGSPGAIRFDPVPGRILEAATGLQFGQAYRVTLRFRSAFWEDNEAFKQVGFLISNDNGFRAWWTMHPIMAPLLTGWTAGSAADRFHGMSNAEIAKEARASLARVLNRDVPPLEAVYFHDWTSDPFYRGAYSYVPVNGLPHRETMATPVEQTLFFAGEATDLQGRGGTVDGALVTGYRSADQVLAASS
jgi:monoamine oxidase